MVYYESLQPKLYQGRDLDPEYHRFAHRQRIELVQAYDEAAVAAVRGRFDGSEFSKERGYEGPGQNTGNQIIPRTFYGPGKTFLMQLLFSIYRTNPVLRSTSTYSNSPATFTRILAQARRCQLS
jgi:hypothetical protein